MVITDAQIHLIAPNTLARPWSIDEPTLHGWSEFDQAAIVEQMAIAGVDRAVLVPSVVDGDRNDSCLAAAEARPDTFAVAGRVDLESPINAGELRQLAGQRGMRALRLTFNRGASGGWLTDGTADWFWAVAEEASIPLYVHAPRQAPEVGRIAEKHPDLKIAIDHLGMTASVTPDEVDPLIGTVVDLARFANVSVKASCVPSLAQDVYPYTSMHDRIHRVVDAFGPDRVFWGSDVTRLKGTYRECVTMFTEELDFLSADALEEVMGRGLEAWLEWPSSVTTS